MAVEERECPLCMEPMEADDLSFYPCDCEYQVCRFCWTKIINEENGLCPACRKIYNSEKPALYKPVADHEYASLFLGACFLRDVKLRANRKKKEHMKKNRLNSDVLKLLPELRYGKVFKVEINQNQTFGGPQGQPSFSAYITFHRPEDAMRSIRELDQGMLHGRTLRVSLGTTKYCSQFLRGSKCTKHECMYLHTVGDPNASFTKEEMQAGKHTEYMNKLLAEYDASFYAMSGSATNSNHIPVTDRVNNSTDDHQQSRTRDALISPRLVASGRELSTSPCPTSSARHPDGSSNILSTSLLKLSTASGQPQPPDIQLSPQPLESSDTRKIPYSGNRSYSNSANVVSHTVASQVAGTSIRTFNSDYGDKHIDWIQPETFSSTSSERSKAVSNRASQMNQITTNYLNGFVGAAPEDNGSMKERHLSKTANSRRGPSKVSNQRLPSAKTTSLSVNIPPQVAGWYRTGQSSECTASQHLTSSGYGDEPVDLGFDPFQESQQGLAELLAAELSQLSAERENSKSPLDYNASNIENTGIRRTRHVDSFVYSKPLQMYWPSSQVDAPDSEENDRLDYPASKHQHDNFTSRLYPPPGFEKSTHSLSAEAVSNPSFPNPVTIKGTQASARLLGSKYQYPSCHIPTQGGFVSTDSIGQTPGEPGVLNNMSVPGLMDKNISVSFPLGFRSEVNHDKLNGAVSCENVGNSSGPVGIPLLSEANVNPLRLEARQQQEQQQQQAMANLFAAAFNTASAILNSNRQQQQQFSDDKVSVGCTASPPPFDLNAFFNQLYRQSPFLFSHTSSGGSNSVNSSSPFNSITDWIPDGDRCRPDTVLPIASENVDNSDTTTTTSFAKSNNHRSADSNTAPVSASVPLSILDTAMPPTTVIIPSMLPFVPQPPSDYSLNSPLYPPGLVKPSCALSNQMTSSHNLNKTLIGSHFEHHAGNTYSPSVNPSSVSSLPSEHIRPVTGPLTWQLDDPAIVTDQLHTNTLSPGVPGWKQSTNCNSTDDDDAIAAAASLRQFWQNDPTVQQLFDQHLLQSSVNYAIHTGNSGVSTGASCLNNNQSQKITCPSSSAIPLQSTANTTESSE